jgi:hypothetical protein
MWDTVGRQVSRNRCSGLADCGEPILGLGLHLNSSPWRLGPAWAVLAGAIACQAPIWGGESLLRLGGALLLADALWGILWRRPSSVRCTRGAQRPSAALPYADARSPMAQLLSGLRWEAEAGAESGWQGVAAGLGLVAVLSILLGSAAVVLSLLVFAAAIVVRLLVRQGREPLLIGALLSTGFPWLLGCTLGGAGVSWPPGQAAVAGVGLGVGFTVLTWALLKVEYQASQGGMWPVWVAQAVILCSLAAFRVPVGMAAVVGCFVAPCLWSARWPRRLPEVNQAVRSSDVWWLASMLVAALAVRY